MSETFSREAVEQEIAVLSEAIRTRRAILEKEKGLVEEGGEKEFVKEAVAEKIRQILPEAPLQKSPSGSPVHYLDRLDNETNIKITHLAEEAFSKGLRKTLKSLEHEEPFMVDALHDLLVDKYYKELKARGFVK